MPDALPPVAPGSLPSPASVARDPRLGILGDLYPFESHYLDVDGIKMHYVDEGSGPPVLMLHGNPTWSFYYRDLIKGLRDRFRIIAPDHVGCGFSDKPRVYPYTLATHIANLTRLVDRLNLTDVTLAVHDWGGPIGFGWATRQPRKVRRFVVFNTAAFMGGAVPLRLRICRWPVVGDLAVCRLNGFARTATRVACRKRDRMTLDVKRGYLLPYDTAAGRIALLRFVRDIPLRRSAPSYTVVTQIQLGLTQFQDRPMIIFWGMKDFCFTPWFLEEWIARFPRASVHRFADAGHYVVEDAHDEILPLLSTFLT